MELSLQGTQKVKRDGLGRFPDVSLFDARQHALSNKQLLRKNIDPIDEKNRAEVLRQQQNKKFSEIAEEYIRTKKIPEWTSARSYQSWTNTLKKYATPILDNKPMIDINRDDIIRVLRPIWRERTETGRKIQQRLFLIFAFAKIRGCIPMRILHHGKNTQPLYYQTRIKFIM